MPIVRHYVMTAREGEGPALQAALLDLAAKAAPLDGCDGCELYQDSEQADRFFFLERWQSPEQHKQGGETLGKDAFAPIMAVLAKPPEGLSLLPVSAS
jgi:heme oxygenase (mycobilin-producing)